MPSSSGRARACPRRRRRGGPRRGRAAPGETRESARRSAAPCTRQVERPVRPSGPRRPSTARSVPSPARCSSRSSRRPVPDRDARRLAVAHRVVGQPQVAGRGPASRGERAAGRRAGPRSAPPARPRPAPTVAGRRRAARAGRDRGWCPAPARRRARPRAARDRRRRPPRRASIAARAAARVDHERAVARRRERARRARRRPRPPPRDGARRVRRPQPRAARRARSRPRGRRAGRARRGDSRVAGQGADVHAVDASPRRRRRRRR